jgi:hypothetical protein
LSGQKEAKLLSERERFANDAEADDLFTRKYRRPPVVPEKVQRVPAVRTAAKPAISGTDHKNRPGSS